MITLPDFIAITLAAVALYQLQDLRKQHERRIKAVERREPEKRVNPVMTKKEAKDILPSSWSHCDTKDKFGRHCPEMPVHEIDGGHLCERCFLNYQNSKPKAGTVAAKAIKPVVYLSQVPHKTVQLDNGGLEWEGKL